MEYKMWDIILEEYFMVQFETKVELITGLLYSFALQSRQLSNFPCALLQVIDYVCIYKQTWLIYYCWCSLKCKCVHSYFYSAINLLV